MKNDFEKKENDYKNENHLLYIKYNLKYDNKDIYIKKGKNLKKILYKPD